MAPCNLGNAKAQVGLASSCNANGHMHVVGHVLTRRKKLFLGLWYKILCVCLTPGFFFLVFFLFLFLFCFVSCFVLFCFVCFFFSSLSVNF